jgi:hypothetical protein
MHLHINQMISKNTYNAAYEEIVGIRELLPLLRRMFTYWYAKPRFPCMHYSQPEMNLDLPSLEKFFDLNASAKLV